MFSPMKSVSRHVLKSFLQRMLQLLLPQNHRNFYSQKNDTAQTGSYQVCDIVADL
jgi:hypothetical protein